MTVDITQADCQTSYTLRDGAGLSCALTFGADWSAPAEWTILLPGTGGSSRPFVVHRFAAPVTVRLRVWLTPIIGPGRAAELAAAVGARPPRPQGWQRHTPPAA